MAKSKRSDLGTPISRYHLREIQWRDLLTVFFPLILVVLTPVGYGLWRTLYGYSSFGPAAASSWGRTWFLIGAFLVIPLLFYTLARLKKPTPGLKFTPGVFFYITLPVGKDCSTGKIFKVLPVIQLTSLFYGLSTKPGTT